jgi:signal transduction histidine kinase
MDQPAITVLVTGASAADAARLTRLLAAAPRRAAVETLSALDDALDRLGRGAVDVVLLDLGLAERVDAVTALRERAGAPVVALATDPGAAAISVLRAGAQDCLDAHADAETLARALTHAIERHRAAAAERATLERAWRVRTTDGLRRLAGQIAHDFNNLLTIISGRTELVLAQLPADDPLTRDVTIVRKTVDRAAGVARRLVAFSRRRIRQRSVLDLNHAVGAMAPRLRQLAGERVELRVVLAADPARAFADPEQLEDIAVQLVANARDAMPDGGCITVSTQNANIAPEAARPLGGRLTGACVVLAVADSGRGMDAASRAYVSESWCHAPGCGHGPGMGLAIVAGLVQQGGGAVDVDSEIGCGTTVRVVLPAADARAPERSDLDRP